MKKNMHLIDRGLRFIIGVALIAWAIAGGPFWAFIGVIPLLTAAVGYCPLYSVLKIKKSSEK